MKQEDNGPIGAGQSVKHDGEAAGIGAPFSGEGFGEEIDGHKGARWKPAQSRAV